MEISETVETLKKLADGIDPETGEVLSCQNPFNQPKVIRALFSAIEVLEKSKKNIERKKDLPARSGLSWTEIESKELTEHHKQGLSFAELSKRHQRTTGAITSQLLKLGIIQ